MDLKGIISSLILNWCQVKIEIKPVSKTRKKEESISLWP
jgi:hypothetical protein